MIGYKRVFTGDLVNLKWRVVGNWTRAIRTWNSALLFSHCESENNTRTETLSVTLRLTELKLAVENGPYKETWPPREHCVFEWETHKCTSSSAETNIPAGRKSSSFSLISTFLWWRSLSPKTKRQIWFPLTVV